MNYRNELDRLNVEQLENIIRFNEGGNNTLGEEAYTKEDLMETILAYLDGSETENSETFALLMKNA
jgi:hypothetical protein